MNIPIKGIRSNLEKSYRAGKCRNRNIKQDRLKIIRNFLTISNQEKPTKDKKEIKQETKSKEKSYLSTCN
ncbi:hypothetical protein [endosymbiont GvMRE of Glomus versiforme]|uniref:hypothetical protein n=1 Tax=endosymbiont GvMRE of Glomus versiforme TaxID=2039283 RepID=UPI0011C3F542|nr:hypothetical protein [endosymbiont GvMRE of Glomus versiforme]